MPECPTGNYPARICVLEEQVTTLLESAGHPPAHLDFGAGANSWDDLTQAGYVNVPVIPPAGSADIIVVADDAARAAATPAALSQMLIQTTDAVNGDRSVWVAISLVAGSWSLKVATMGPQNSNAVSITGGTITGITDLSIMDGGTGASTAANARSNFALPTGAPLLSDLDWALTDNYREDLPGNTVYTFSNEQDGKILTVVVEKNGAFTVTWPAGIFWPGGTPPVASGSGFIDVYTFTQVGGQTYGSAVLGYPV